MESREPEIQKALAAACGETREGEAVDAISGARVTSRPGVAVGAEGAEGAEGGSGADEDETGLVPGFVVSPGSTEEAAGVMRVAAERALAVVVRGGGGRLGWGVPPARCDLLIDMSRMSAVIEHSAGDLVARVQAGARMGDAAEVLARAGQEIALDVPPDATIGAVVASGLAGPRRLRYGTPRDLLIGITIIRADGTVARSGGKVVKNVAGYDLGKLLAGSAGTLALITEVTFRLHPLPAARAYVTAEYIAVAVACDAVAAAANSSLVASAVELSQAEPGGPIRVGVLLEGSADGVAARAARMSALLGAAEIAASPPTWWPGPPAAGEGQVLVQVSFWVSALPRVLDAVESVARAGGLPVSVAGSAGAGLLYLLLGPDGAAAGDIARFVSALRSALAAERGGVAVLAAPGPVREALAAGGGLAGTVPALALMRAVKDRFDPGHRMAPGQFPEVI